MPSTSIQLILDTAFSEYANQVGLDPAKHPFADRFQTCHTAEDVLKLLEDKVNEFKDYREGNRKLIDCIKPVVNVIHGFSDVLGEVVSLVPFQPASAIFVGVKVLLTAAIGVSSSYDALIDLFECVGSFLKRLRIYTDLPVTPLMTEISLKIMVEILSVLALATKQIKQGRFKKFAKKLLGESEIEAVLQRLDRLTQEEGRITVAQTLEVVHGLMNTVKVVMTGAVLADGKASMNGIWKALGMLLLRSGSVMSLLS
ncbi:hypothetical protein EI94DRAFT_1707801 [Lactarius quietus]|nr:hypothetical protein EI94DRAFT_1707801 [Lactarius quietus]